jgi:hypothetical protein
VQQFPEPLSQDDLRDCYLHSERTSKLQLLYHVILSFVAIIELVDYNSTPVAPPTPTQNTDLDSAAQYMNEEWQKDQPGT